MDIKHFGVTYNDICILGKINGTFCSFIYFADGLIHPCLTSIGIYIKQQMPICTLIYQFTYEF